MLRSTLAALTALCAGCTTGLDSDLRPLLAEQHFPVTQDDSPPDTETVGMIAVSNIGFYPFSYIPAVPMSLQEAIEAMVRRAQDVGGEGISNVTLHYEEKATFVALAVVYLPDWFRSVTVTGSAWRRKR